MRRGRPTNPNPAAVARLDTRNFRFRILRWQYETTGSYDIELAHYRFTDTLVNNIPHARSRLSAPIARVIRT